MLLRHGIDICSIKRVEHIYLKYGRKFLTKAFTESEKLILLNTDKKNLNQKLAGKFAAKEALIKALDYTTSYSALREIEISHYASGKPCIILHGGILDHYNSLAAKDIILSISHEKDYAIASVIVL